MFGKKERVQRVRVHLLALKTSLSSIEVYCDLSGEKDEIICATHGCELHRFSVAYARGGGGFRGQPPPIDDWKKLTTVLFGPISVFSYRDCVFCAVSNCLYNLEELSL